MRILKSGYIPMGRFIWALGEKTASTVTGLGVVSVAVSTLVSYGTVKNTGQAYGHSATETSISGVGNMENNMDLEFYGFQTMCGESIGGTGRTDVLVG